MTDAEKVAAIERKAELRLLERLLAERERPVPPAPKVERYDENLRNDLIAVMELLAEVVHTNYPKQSNGQRAVVIAMRSRRAS